MGNYKHFYQLFMEKWLKIRNLRIKLQEKAMQKAVKMGSFCETQENKEVENQINNTKNSKKWKIQHFFDIFLIIKMKSLGLKSVKNNQKRLFQSKNQGKMIFKESKTQKKAIFYYICIYFAVFEILLFFKKTHFRQIWTYSKRQILVIFRRIYAKRAIYGNMEYRGSRGKLKPLWAFSQGA